MLCVGTYASITTAFTTLPHVYAVTLFQLGVGGRFCTVVFINILISILAALCLHCYMIPGWVFLRVFLIFGKGLWGGGGGGESLVFISTLQCHYL